MLNGLRILCQFFAVVALFLYALCGQLLYLYNRDITGRLEQLVSDGMFDNRCLSLLRQYRPLLTARRQLYNDFRFPLLAGCCLNLVTVLTSSYFLVEYYLSPHKVVMLWDLSDFLLASFRFWLACHTADRIRSSVRFRYVSPDLDDVASSVMSSLGGCLYSYSASSSSANENCRGA